MQLKATLFFLLWLCVSTTLADSLPELEDVIEKTTPSIVTITTYKHLDQNLRDDSAVEIPKNLRHLFEAKEKSEVIDQTGTGFFVSKQGYLMTCLHIVKNAEKVIVSLYDKRKFPAHLVASDSVSDLALLKIEGKDFPALTFEMTKSPKVGAWVFVIGAPYGFDFSANLGIVSAVNRTLSIREGSETIPYLQTSIAISPGHSGSPVVNLSGKVVGITTHIFTDQLATDHLLINKPGSIGISFAVPASYAEPLSRKWIF
jgi:serine protease Do